MNYYEILEINHDATSSEIKQAYKSLSLKWHPDKNLDNSEQANHKFREINEAYETLKDQDKKIVYDFQLQGVGSGSSSGATDISPEEFFRELNKVSLFFNQFNQGLQGHLPQTHHGNMFFFHNIPQPQPQQQFLLTRPCTLEQIYQNQAISIHLPSPINQDKIFYPKEGEWKEDKLVFSFLHSNFENNNIILHLIPNEHPVFQIKGYDIHTTITLSLKEALCGFQYALTFLDGRIFRLQGTGGELIYHPENSTKILNQLGLEGKGNLIMNFKIQQTKLTETQIQQLNDIL
jgi:DnaJ-class molecular chaperone